jgi:hypothetical protein
MTKYVDNRLNRKQQAVFLRTTIASAMAALLIVPTGVWANICDDRYDQCQQKCINDVTPKYAACDEKYDGDKAWCEYRYEECLRKECLCHIICTPEDCPEKTCQPRKDQCEREAASDHSSCNWSATQGYLTCLEPCWDAWVTCS